MTGSADGRPIGVSRGPHLATPVCDLRRPSVGLTGNRALAFFKNVLTHLRDPDRRGVRRGSQRLSVMIVGDRIESPVGGRSGYEQLIPQVASLTDLSAVALPGYKPRLLPGRFTTRIAATGGSVWYHNEGLALEAEAARRMMSGFRGVVHTLYGENHYRFLGSWPAVRHRRGAAVLATFHQPPSVLSEVYPDASSLSGLDGAIALAGSQCAFLRDFLPPERIFVIPHGVDTGFFEPAIAQRKHAEACCLFVGEWLRDFPSLRAVAGELSRRRPGVSIRVLTPEDRWPDLENLPNMQMVPRTSDKELVAEYQRATCLLLPLVDSTANNALLEAASCSLPAVVTDVGGVRDYVDSRSAILAPPGDVRAMVAGVEALLDDPDLGDAMGQHARRRALELDWAMIAERVVSTYRHVSTGCGISAETLAYRAKDRT